MSKFVRNPIRAIREPFGKAGLTVAILALVLGLVGGAWAAGGLTGKQKKEVKAIAKSFQGTGPAGAAGAAGTNGTNGAPGKNGTAGKEGLEGKEGSPWTAGGTLPKGSTEKGEWNIEQFIHKSVGEGGQESGKTSISFPVPLAAALPEAKVQSNSVGFPTADKAACEAEPDPEVKAACLAGLAESEENCPGSVTEPKAKSGFLCVYTENLSPTNTYIRGLHVLKFGEGGANPFGAELFALPPTSYTGQFTGLGSWAVTG